MRKYTNYFKSSADYKSSISGDFSNSKVWLAKGPNNNFSIPDFIPEEGNNIFIESGCSMKLTQNLKCKDINLSTAANNIIRIVSNGFILDFYGKLRFYSGAAPGTSDSVNDGGPSWISDGTIRAKGSSRTLLVNGEVNANANNTNVTFDHALDPGQTGTMSAPTVRFGYIVVSSGTFLMSVSTGSVRLVGDGSALDQLNMQGLFTVKSGATCKGGVALQRAPTSAMLTVLVEQGGILWITVNNYIIGAQNINLFGEVIMDIAGASNMPNNTARQFGSAVDTYYSLTLQNTGAYSLQFNTTINTVLRMIATSTIVLNSKTLSYGATADLRISTTRTSGNELPTSGAGSTIPRNLIIDPGVVYTVVGTKNIRGTISLGAGASIIGTVNQNQL